MSLASSSVALLKKDPASIRKLLEDLGPTFIKVGQFLAMRPDLVDQSYCDELLALVDRAPAFPWPTARRILTEDLGREPEEVFEWIDPQPLAAASLAQVHAARTRDGVEVAVKVQREDAREAVERDLARAGVLVSVLEVVGQASGPFPLRETLDELRAWLHEELDLGVELRNLTQMRQLSRSNREVRIPRPYPELSGPRVLTAELFRGVPFSELLRVARAGQWQRIKDLGLSPLALARRLVWSVLQQIFVHQFFHADTHPGNLIALPGSRVGFVDFGLCDTLDSNFRTGMYRYLGAIFTDNIEGMYRALTEILVADDRTDLDGFHRDFLSVTRAWLRARDRQDAERRQDGERSPIAAYITGVMRAARENGMRVPPQMLSMYRSLFTAETVAHQLDPRANLRTVGRRFVAELRTKQVLKPPDRDKLWALGADMADLVVEGPGQLGQLLSDLAQDRFQLRVRTTPSKAEQRGANIRVRMIAIGLAQVALSVLLVGADRISEQYAGWVRGGLGVLLAAAFTWGAVLWRRLR